MKQPDRGALPVLVVDDDDELRATTAETLARAGFTVTACPGADAALAALAAGDHGAVVSDFRMPGMDGVELLARVRRSWPDAERVLVTGHADLDVLERAVNEAAISRFLKKPWTPPALLAVVDEAHRTAVLRREHRLLEARLQGKSEELALLGARLREHEEGGGAAAAPSDRWAAGLQSISDPVAVVGVDLDLEGVNLAAAALAGAPGAGAGAAEGPLGQKCHLALFGRPSPCPGCPIASGAGLVASRDGRRTFEARAYALPGGHGAHLCFYRDVTRHAALLAEAAEIERVAAVARVAAGVAHEINNPLHGILSFAQLAQRADLPADKRARYLEQIRQGALRCRDIVQSMRELARRTTPPPDGVFDLRKVCARALEPFAATLGSRLVRRLGDDAAPARCRGDARRLEQVVVNLVQNAIDASPPGGRVQVTVERDGAHWVIAVDDEGPGVPPALRARVFEPFFTTKPEGVGTGLGLAISHTILRELRGALRVTDGGRGGARFEARLPGAGDGDDEGPNVNRDVNPIDATKTTERHDA